MSAELQRAYGVSVRIEDPLRPAPGQGAALYEGLVTVFWQWWPTMGQAAWEAAARRAARPPICGA